MTLDPSPRTFDCSRFVLTLLGSVAIAACGGGEPSAARVLEPTPEPALIVAAECTSDVACLDPRSPACVSGRCVSCAGQACSPETAAREVQAVLCERQMHGTPVMPTEFAARAQASAEAAVCTARGGDVGMIVANVRAGALEVDLARFRTFVSTASTLTLPLLVANFDGLHGSRPDGVVAPLSALCASGRVHPGADGIPLCASRIAVGGECFGDWEQNGGCERGLACIYEAGAQVCRAARPPTRADVGGRCAFDQDCIEALVCTDAECSEPPHAGMRCAFGIPRCAANAACVDDRCVTTVRIGTAPRPLAPCPVGSRASGEPLRCLPFAPVGAACAEASCPHGAACVAGRCAALPDVGQGCTSACYRGTCTEGVCADLAVGADCSAGMHTADALDACGMATRCWSDAGSSAWTCHATRDVGEPCDDQHACRGFDLWCSTVTAHCAPFDP